MALKQKLIHELEELAAATLFFGCWIATLLLFKELLLAEYDIVFRHWTMALIGALILAKVVLLLDGVSFGPWVRSRPAWIDVVLRTVLFTIGVTLVLMLEKGIEGRHEHGGFFNAVSASLRGVDAAHLWVNVLCVSGALLCYNSLRVIRHHLGGCRLPQLFMKPLPETPTNSQPN